MRVQGFRIVRTHTWYVKFIVIRGAYTLTSRARETCEQAVGGGGRPITAPRNVLIRADKREVACVKVACSGIRNVQYRQRQMSLLRRGNYFRSSRRVRAEAQQRETHAKTIVQ